MTRDFEILIDELILDGFNLSDRYAIADALEKELGSLLREKPFRLAHLRPDLEIDHLLAGSVSIKPGARGASLGAQLGQAIFSSLQASMTPTAPAETSPAKTEALGKPT